MLIRYKFEFRQKRNVENWKIFRREICYKDKFRFNEGWLKEYKYIISMMIFLFNFKIILSYKFSIIEWFVKKDCYI